jgi:hypothetical protein
MLVGATCNPMPSGGALISLSVDELAPLQFDATDGRFTDSPPELEVTLVRASDGEEAMTTLALAGSLAEGFTLVESDAALELASSPCEDTREVAVRFELVPGVDWADSVGSEYGAVEADLVLLPDSAERIETWEAWTLLLTPEISFPTETIASNDEPLKCVAD